MSYNLAVNSFIATNTSSGNVSLTTDQLRTILRSDLTSLVALSGDDILYIDIDLGMRIKIDEIQYYFTSTSSMEDVASGIQFYYRNDDPDSYSLLPTQLDSYYYATVSGLSAPRYLRIIHTISGTSISGTLNKIQVLNDDTIVNFGEAGTLSSEHFEMDLEEVNSDIREVKVFNSGPYKANAYVFLEYQGNDADTLFSISNSEDGPWYGIKDADDLVVGYPIWSRTSILTNLYSKQNQIDMSLTSGSTSGTCTTMIFEANEDQRLSNLVIEKEYPIVQSGTVFFDDFSAGGGNWGTWAYGTSSYNLGYLKNTGDDCDVRTKTTFNYSHDWILRADIKNDGWSNTYQPGMTFVALGATSGYIHLEFNKPSAYINLNINGVQRGTYYLVPAVYTNWQGQWITIVVQRTFNTVRYKVWRRDLDTEPVDWAVSTTIIYSDVSDTGYIQLYDAWNITYMDNVRLDTNCSSNGQTRGMISVDPEDTTETVEMRSSNTKPKNVDMYYEHYGNYPCNMRRRWLDNDSVENNNVFGSLNGGLYYMTVDPKNENVYMFKSGYYGYEVIFGIGFGTGTLSQTGNMSGEDPRNGNSVQGIFPTSEEGFWVSYYLSTGTQYVLRYFTKTLSNSFYRKEAVSFIVDLCVEYNTSYLWYIDKTSQFVLRMGKTGVLDIGYDATDLGARSIMSSKSGDYIWVLIDNAILKLNNSAEFVSSIDMDTSTMSKIRNSILEDGFWVVEEETKITKMDYSGNRIFSVNVLASPVDLIPITSGLIVRDLNNKYHYISSEQQRIVRESFLTSSALSGFLSYEFDDIGTYRTTARVPVSNDYTWNNIAWKKVSIDDYSLNKDKYRQLRVHARANNSNESPILKGVYKQRSIKLDDIDKGYSKSFYLKSDVTGLTVSGVGTYNSNIKVWWYLPV